MTMVQKRTSSGIGSGIGGGATGASRIGGGAIGSGIGGGLKRPTMLYQGQSNNQKQGAAANGGITGAKVTNNVVKPSRLASGVSPGRAGAPAGVSPRNA